MKFVLVIISTLLLATVGLAQDQKVITYYDQELKQKKEVYFLKEGTQLLNGPYTSYYIDGHKKELGTFEDNQPVGHWEYFFENGSLKMSGEIRDNLNYGPWQYYFENGNLSMEGSLYHGVRDGLWHYYYESGALKSRGEFSNGSKVKIWNTFFEDSQIKSQIYYSGDRGDFKEFYNSGKLKAAGIKINDKNEGAWEYYYENGVLQARGGYVNGIKQGLWEFYHPNGTSSAVGTYKDGLGEGEWTYYDEQGTVTSQGVERSGRKDGYWHLYYEDGSIKGRGLFNDGEGFYKEYYESGALKVSGLVKNGINEGKWLYYYEDGILEGESRFVKGTGEYKGYYKDGALKMQGIIENGIKTGIWSLYNNDGSLAGYYKTYYEDNKPVFRIIEESTPEPDTIRVTYEKPEYLFKKKRIRYFRPQVNEFRGIIIGTNPVSMAVGSIPFSVEYYMQERLGYELQYSIVRDPFFTSDANVRINEIYDRGYSLALRQKFYSEDGRLGMFYFGHELRFSTIDHFANIVDSLNIVNRSVIGADEKRYEYSLLLGYRFLRDAGGTGITIDSFIGLGIGYRDYNRDYPEVEDFEGIFDELDTDELSIPFRFGINIGFMLEAR
ncbi:MAG: membrane-binding protein [Cyclobacteriaceae bacterium]|nr:membrane-binding protein [Cyclobacteriaceae bacterium]